MLLHQDTEAGVYAMLLTHEVVLQTFFQDDFSNLRSILFINKVRSMVLKLLDKNMYLAMRQTVIVCVVR